MTEDEWLAATSPKMMVKRLVDLARMSERRLRLFACACCRRVLSQDSDARARRLVETAEQMANGVSTPADVDAARLAAVRLRDRSTEDVALCISLVSGHFVGIGCWRWAAYYAGKRAAVGKAEPASTAAFLRIASAEEVAQAATLRDVIGNPFRPAPVVDPAWLAWRDGVVRELARVAYEERRMPEGTLVPARLVALADALERAGCREAELLGHLREPGPHVRGCWAVDLLLGRD